MKITIRILIVENRELTRLGLEDMFTHMSGRLLGGRITVAFAVEAVASVEEVMPLLAQAARTGRPYDVMLFDVGLQPTKAVYEDRPELGLMILRELDPRSCRAVVIASGHHANSEVMTDLVRLRVAWDFVQKPFEEDLSDVLRSVLRAFCGSQHALWDQILRAHETEWNVAQARAEAADAVIEATLPGVQRALDDLDDLGESARLAYDSQDEARVLLRGLEAVKQALLDARKDGALKRDQITPNVGELGPLGHGECAELVNGLLDHLRPGLCSRVVAVEVDLRELPRVHTYAEGVGTILKEVLTSAVAAAPEASTLRVTARLGREGAGVAQIQVRDEADALGTELCRKINAREAVGREDNRRAWGLYLANRVAGGIGAWLDVEPAAPGTCVILSIPLTHHDHITGSHR